ncbi:GAF and ANTAR domain-containing protein [Auraticoccus cholistanensis]|nr:GAF and ANTAR domain-containing protein [Auraticoccus cholistanensis]
MDASVIFPWPRLRGFGDEEAAVENPGFAEQLSDAAQQMEQSKGERETLDAAVLQALTIVRGCAAAGLSELGPDRRLRTTAATSELVVRGDRLQHDLGEGPCVSAIRDQTLVWSPDLSTETRWPRWSAAVHAQLGVRSMLSVQLYSGERGFGALNLYGTEPDAFDEHDRSAVVALGTQIAVAIANARRDEQLRRAIDSRTVIGQAQGLLMERFGLTAETAFAYLQRVSQSTNTKFFAVAEELVRTRTLPSDELRAPVTSLPTKEKEAAPLTGIAAAASAKTPPAPDIAV